MKAPAKILIIRLSSLGDILHALPAFESLRSTFPGARIDWLVEKRMSFILSAVRGIDAVYTVDSAGLKKSPGRQAPWQEFLRLVGELRSRRYDLSLDFQGLLKSAALGLLSGARERIGFGRDRVREWPAHWFYHCRVSAPHSPIHVVKLNQLLVRAAGARGGRSTVDLQPSEADIGIIRARLKQEQLSQFVVINPGGGWPTKRWHPARYGALAERLQSELDLPVIVTTGPGEENLYLEMAQQCRAFKLRHFQVSFLQLIPLYRKARLLIGGDTGPFHLACVVGTPVVGIFGPTSPARNGPWSDRDESVVRTLDCSFCHGRTCPTGNECMDLTVDEVFRAVVKRLETIP